MTEQYTCAVWYVNEPGLLGYELCTDDTAAARRAVYMYDLGECDILGVQFADGRVLRRDEWPAYQAAANEARCRAAFQAPPRPVRRIRSPISWAAYRDEEIIEVDAGEPLWLGIAGTADP